MVPPKSLSLQLVSAAEERALPRAESGKKMFISVVIEKASKDVVLALFGTKGILN